MGETDYQVMIAAKIAALSEPFNPGLVKKKQGQGGRMMDYISHGLVTERLNKVAPDWSWRTITEHIYTDTNGHLHCAAVTVEMTIGGVSRVESGGPQRQDGLTNELKNAYSDAIKRAAMRFGVALNIWESLVDAEYDEDAHPEIVAQAITPVRPRMGVAPVHIPEPPESTPIRPPATRRPTDEAGQILEEARATYPLIEAARTVRSQEAARPPIVAPFANSAPRGCNIAVVTEFLKEHGFAATSYGAAIKEVNDWIRGTFPGQPLATGTGDWDAARNEHKMWPSDLYNAASHYFALCEEPGDPAVTVAAGGIHVTDDDVPF